MINSDKSHLLGLAGQGVMLARRLEVQLHAGPDIIEQSTSDKLLVGVVHNYGGWKQMIRDGKNSIVFQFNSRPPLFRQPLTKGSWAGLVTLTLYMAE